MGIMERLRCWWQIRTGEEETPFDGDLPAWVVSLGVHLGLLVLLALFLRDIPREEGHVELVTTLIEPEEQLPEEFFFSHLEKEEIGANSIEGVDMAEAIAEMESDISELYTLEVEPDVELPAEELIVESVVDTSVAIQMDTNMIVQGAAGAGTTGAAGAIDRITQEIIDSLDERKTLVIWVFDQSVSLSGQREAIYKRLDRIYEELGVIEASGNARFSKHHDKPLLSAVVAFGQQVTFRNPEPTDQVSKIKAALAGIESDRSGVESVFTAVAQTAEKYSSYSVSRAGRNVMMVLFTDEAGDDAQSMLDPAVGLCRRYVMPVYVVGVPSPFGRKEVDVKWIDPDPNYDQKPQWAQVNQGPETMYPERLRLAFSGTNRNTDPLDSGFGPFALTRLAVETGGIYFSVHPNRNPDRPVTRAETAHLSAYIKYFFDPDVMRPYRPDYVSFKEYKRLLSKNKAKTALVNASLLTWVHQTENPELRFPRKSEPELANLLSEAQQSSAKMLAGVLTRMVEELKRGERDREKIVEPRWQAGYDLGMGRALAVKVRTEGYNLMLAAAKRGMKFKDPKSDTWYLRPADDILSGSKMEKQAVRARAYLQRVVDDHPGTPWAVMASRELGDPMGWRWDEAFENVNPPRRQAAGNNNPPNPPNPRDEKRRMIPRKQKRSPPKL